MSREWTYTLLGGRNKNGVEKKRQINVIKQKSVVARNWVCSPLSQDGFDLIEAIFSFAAPSPGPTSSLLYLSLISPGVSDGNWPPSCLSDENQAATVWPTNNLLIISMFSFLNGSFGILQGEEGVRAALAKQQCVCGVISCLALGNELASLSW